MTDEALASETATEISGDSDNMDVYADDYWRGKMLPNRDHVKGASEYISRQ